MVILIYVDGLLDTLNSKKKFTNVILKEIILIYVRTLKIDPKSYEHGLNISSWHNNIFYFSNIKIATIMLKFDKK